MRYIRPVSSSRWGVTSCDHRMLVEPFRLWYSLCMPLSAAKKKHWIHNTTQLLREGMAGCLKLPKMSPSLCASAYSDSADCCWWPANIIIPYLLADDPYSDHWYVTTLSISHPTYINVHLYTIHHLFDSYPCISNYLPLHSQWCQFYT